MTNYSYCWSKRFDKESLVGYSNKKENIKLQCECEAAKTISRKRKGNSPKYQAIGAGAILKKYGTVRIKCPILSIDEPFMLGQKDDPNREPFAHGFFVF